MGDPGGVIWIGFDFLDFLWPRVSSFSPTRVEDVDFGHKVDSLPESIAGKAGQCWM